MENCPVVLARDGVTSVNTFSRPWKISLYGQELTGPGEGMRPGSENKPPRGSESHFLSELSTSAREMLPGESFEPEFYDRKTEEVAKDLLGRIVVHITGDSIRAGRIVEVEAYLGLDDPACHVGNGRGLTSRTRDTFGRPGCTYVFLVYGLHHCLNAITLSEPPYGCVLIRAVEPWDLESGALWRGATESPSGPGLTCRYLDITRAQNGTHLSEGPVLILNRGLDPRNVSVTTRIGISAWKDRPLRFFDKDSDYVSKPLGH